MNEVNSNDDILFDRLVDGELSADERRALLASLDKRPGGWRKCALAFLEAQSWQSELRSVAAKPQSATPISAATAPTPLRKRRTIRAVAQWLAVAAALLVAFKAGSLQRGPELPIAANNGKATDQVVSVSPGGGATGPNAAAANAAKPGDAINLWVRDDAGQMRRVRVPLVDAKQLDNELGLTFQTGVPDDVRNKLQSNGYAVQSKRQYAPLWLDNGRPMIVPVEDTKIVPVSNKVY